MWEKTPVSLRIHTHQHRHKHTHSQAYTCKLCVDFCEWNRRCDARTSERRWRERWCGLWTYDGMEDGLPLLYGCTWCPILVGGMLVLFGAPSANGRRLGGGVLCVVPRKSSFMYTSSVCMFQPQHQPSPPTTLPPDTMLMCRFRQRKSCVGGSMPKSVGVFQLLLVYAHLDSYIQSSKCDEVSRMTMTSFGKAPPATTTCLYSG